MLGCAGDHCWTIVSRMSARGVLEWDMRACCTLVVERGLAPQAVNALSMQLVRLFQSNRCLIGERYRV